MFQALSKFIFKKQWNKKCPHLGSLNDREIEHYLKTSARENQHLPKNIQVEKAAEMAADDYAGDGIHY